MLAAVNAADHLRVVYSQPGRVPTPTASAPDEANHVERDGDDQDSSIRMATCNPLHIDGRCVAGVRRCVAKGRRRVASIGDDVVALAGAAGGPVRPLAILPCNMQSALDVCPLTFNPVDENGRACGREPTSGEARSRRPR